MTIMNVTPRVCYDNGGGVLPDWMIEEQVRIEPFVKDLRSAGVLSYGLSSFGYDFRLGSTFALFKNEPYQAPRLIDPKAFDQGLPQKFTSEVPWPLPPHSFCLAESLETVWIPDAVVAICLGKSSYCRCGMVINCTPLESAWTGKITIEMVNTTDDQIMVYPGEGVMQTLFLHGLGRPRVTYADRKGKYQGQTGLTYPSVLAAQEP